MPLGIDERGAEEANNPQARDALATTGGWVTGQAFGGFFFWFSDIVC